MAADAWLSIPQAYRIYGSNATKSGTWTTVTNDIFQPTTTSVVGNPVTNATSGSALTFSIPTSASNKVGITYKVVTGQSGSFSATIDGASVADNCSATTTFSTAPCATNPLPLAGGTFYRQEYSVTPNQSHSVVITNGASGCHRQELRSPISFSTLMKMRTQHGQTMRCGIQSLPQSPQRSSPMDCPYI